MSIGEIEVETLHEDTLEEQRCVDHYFVEVDDEQTFKKSSPSSTPTLTPAKVANDSDDEVIPSIQYEDAQMILDHLGIIPPENEEHMSISQFLMLPTLPQTNGRNNKTSEPIIGYSKSIILNRTSTWLNWRRRHQRR